MKFNEIYSLKLKYIRFILFFGICLLNYDCRKKISKYPFDLKGYWFSNDLYCDIVLVVQDNSQAQLITAEGRFCSSGHVIVQGTMKYVDNYFYINRDKNYKMKVIEKPIEVNGTDSIYAPDENNIGVHNYTRRKILGNMVLEINDGWGRQRQYHFSKFAK